MWLNRKDYEALVVKAATLAGEANNREKQELLFVDKIGMLIASNKDLSHRLAIVEAKNIELQDLLAKQRVTQGNDSPSISMPIDGMFDEAPEDVEQTIKELEQYGEQYLVAKGRGDG